MVFAYGRISQDEDKKNYISIENQKVICEKFALENNLIIDKWFEDDGVSGYSFNRPGFSQMIDMLFASNEKDIIIAKDLSRIGRHNAKVLLFLDELKEQGKRLILVDDNYDSSCDDDDMVGIKTWFNERYIKDTSKKIRRVLKTKQELGTFISATKFGYEQDKTDRTKVNIVEAEATIIRKIKDLYMNGFGDRRIANILNDENIPTPSKMIRDRELLNGKSTKRKIAPQWTDKMVGEILKDDYYIGTRRTHVRNRVIINGTDKRVPKEEQIKFEDHHMAIIEPNEYELIQEIRKKRNKNNYRGQKNIESNLFGACSFCKDCGSRLTHVVRKRKYKTSKYYICSNYNMKGNKYCSSHSVNENDLMSDVIKYVCLCKDSLRNILETFDINELIEEKATIDRKKNHYKELLAQSKNELKIILEQKVKDMLAASHDTKMLISETYENMQDEIMVKIRSYEKILQELNAENFQKENIKEKLETAYDVVNSIIERGRIKRKDVEILIEKIVVDENGIPEIELKYGLSDFVHYSAMDELNRYEQEVILNTMQIIMEEKREYTSAKHISEELNKRGLKKSKKAVIPYIKIMIENGILRPTEDKLKPYEILIEKQNINDMIKSNIVPTSGGWNARNDL